MQVMTLELKLRDLRERAGMTQADLAAAVDVRIATISDLEKDKSRRIEFDLIEKLCKVLSEKIDATITPNDLFGPAKKRRRGK
jgi:transcriptional regulator with XRE-family HTH domain